MVELNKRYLLYKLRIFVVNLLSAVFVIYQQKKVEVKFIDMKLFRNFVWFPKAINLYLNNNPHQQSHTNYIC